MKSIITINSDGYTSISQHIFQQYLAERHKFSVNGMYMTNENVEEFFKQLNEKYDFERHDFDITNLRKSSYISFTDGDDKFDIVMATDTKDTVEVDGYYSSIELAKQIYDIQKPLIYKGNNAIIEFHHFYLSKNNSIEKAHSIKEYSDYTNTSASYYPFLDVQEMFKQFTLSQESLLILTGEPGTGKTKIAELYLKFLLENPDILENPIELEEDSGSRIIRVAYIKNTEILSRDDFWVNLSHSEEPFDVVVLDDIDYMLTTRTASNEGYKANIKDSFISNFLSFSDGLFSSEYSTKFILATNQNIDHIDQAITRKGRCFDILTFRKLSNKEALFIWEERGLDKKQFNKIFKNCEYIQACDLGSHIEQTVRTNAKNIKLKPYVLEQNISTYDQSKPKKIGVI